MVQLLQQFNYMFMFMIIMDQDANKEDDDDYGCLVTQLEDDDD